MAVQIDLRNRWVREGAAQIPFDSWNASQITHIMMEDKRLSASKKYMLGLDDLKAIIGRQPTQNERFAYLLGRTQQLQEDADAITFAAMKTSSVKQ